jgi:hypothetical protein
MTTEPTPIAYASLALAPPPARAFDAERSRIAEWPWDMWCNICRIRPTSHRTEAQALEAADQHVVLYHAPPAEVHQLMAAGGLAELQRLRAEVEQLRTERDHLDGLYQDAEKHVGELLGLDDPAVGLNALACTCAAEPDDRMPPRQCGDAFLDWMCQRAAGHSGRHTDTTGGRKRTWSDDAEEPTT